MFRKTSQALPANIETKLNKKIAKAEYDSSTQIVQICWSEEMDAHAQNCQNVKRLLINYYIPLAGPLPDEPGEYKEPYGTWVTLIPLIGTICREIFPNLTPEESNFNVHVGFYHYHEGAHLLPDAVPNRINLKQR